jgi:O-antigen/teichoic acid export membrane protein
MAIRNLGKQTIIYGLGHVLARLITFLLLPLYTHTFTKESYGAISLAYAFMGFTMILYRYGMDTALLKFSVQKVGIEKKEYTSVIVATQLITSIIFSLILYYLRGSISFYVLGVNRPDWMTFIIIILFLDSFWNLPMLILRSEEKAIPFIFFSLLNVTVTMLLNIYFVVYQSNGVEGVFKANILASGIVCFLSIPIIYKSISIKHFDRKILLNILKFSIPFLPAGIFTMVMELSDRYMIEWILGTSEVGLYSAGKKMGMLGLTAVMGFNMGWTPYFLKRGKIENAKEEFKIITTIFLGLIGFICFLVSLWISKIMRFSILGTTLIGAEFWDCEPIVILILTGYFFFGVYVLQLPGIYIKEQTKWVPIFRIIGASVLIFSSLIIIPKVGIVGAAYAVVLSFFSMSIAIYVKSQSVYPIAYNRAAVIVPILFLFVAYLGVENISLKILFSFTYPLIWYFFVFEKKDKRELRKQIKYFLNN